MAQSLNKGLRFFITCNIMVEHINEGERAMTDSDKPNVVELKGISKEPVDENTKHLLETLGAVTQIVRDGSIQQICFTMIDTEGDLSVTVGGVSTNPYKMAYSLQNDVSYIYLTMVGEFDDE